MKKLSFAGLKGRVSWGSVFGGVMTVLAISVLLSILNSSIGLFMFDPLSDHPVAGIGTAVGIGPLSFWLPAWLQEALWPGNWPVWTE